MNTFDIHLQSQSELEIIGNVESFVAQDETGSFGIMSGHTRFMTALGFGLAKFRQPDSAWRYIALPGGLAYFTDNRLIINTRRFILGDSYATMNDILLQELQKEEENLKTIKNSLYNLEQEIFKRMWQLKHQDSSLL